MGAKSAEKENQKESKKDGVQTTNLDIGGKNGGTMDVEGGSPSDDVSQNHEHEAEENNAKVYGNLSQFGIYGDDFKPDLTPIPAHHTTIMCFIIFAIGFGITMAMQVFIVKDHTDITKASMKSAAAQIEEINTEAMLLTSGYDSLVRGTFDAADKAVCDGLNGFMSHKYSRCFFLLDLVFYQTKNQAKDACTEAYSSAILTYPRSVSEMYHIGDFALFTLGISNAKIPINFNGNTNNGNMITSGDGKFSFDSSSQLYSTFLDCLLCCIDTSTEKSMHLEICDMHHSFNYATCSFDIA